LRRTYDTGDAIPYRQSLRWQPFGVQGAVEEQGTNMLKAGVIELSSSPWVSNVVMVKKKDGTLRFCVDYPHLNALNRQDAYLLPQIDACLNAMTDARYFSTFNLRAGYHQVAMSETNADKTFFVTKSGTYCFRRMPFGLCNAGSTFQRLMDVTMRD
jgi:hypothetical protein